MAPTAPPFTSSGIEGTKENFRENNGKKIPGTREPV